MVLTLCAKRTSRQIVKFACRSFLIVKMLQDVTGKAQWLTFGSWRGSSWSQPHFSGQSNPSSPLQQVVLRRGHVTWRVTFSGALGWRLRVVGMGSNGCRGQSAWTWWVCKSCSVTVIMAWVHPTTMGKGEDVYPRGHPATSPGWLACGPSNLSNLFL